MLTHCNSCFCCTSLRSNGHCLFGCCLTCRSWFSCHLFGCWLPWSILSLLGVLLFVEPSFSLDFALCLSCNFLRCCFLVTALAFLLSILRAGATSEMPNGLLFMLSSFSLFLFPSSPFSYVSPTLILLAFFLADSIQFESFLHNASYLWDCAICGLKSNHSVLLTLLCNLGKMIVLVLQTMYLNIGSWVDSSFFLNEFLPALCSL